MNENLQACDRKLYLQTLRVNCTTDANCASGQACNSYYNPPQCSTLAPKECFAGEFDPRNCIP